MCNNRKYSKKDQKRFDRIVGFAIEILEKGKTISEIAAAEGTSEDEINVLLEELQEVNPYLYKQLKSKG